MAEHHMQTVDSISLIPARPGIYAMLSGNGERAYVAYVGVGENLRRRIHQHSVRRDSSVTTGVAAVTLQPDLITEARWWTHPALTDMAAHEAAEQVAAEVLRPVLRSRGAVSGEAHLADATFREAMDELFRGEAAGCHVPPTLEDALRRIGELERRVGWGCSRGCMETSVVRWAGVPVAGLSPSSFRADSGVR